MEQRDQQVGVLSPDQRHVLELAATGAVTSDIARMLDLAPAEVREHAQAAIAALGARSKMEAVIIALRHGLIALCLAAR